jgi:hypothetical protein
VSVPLESKKPQPMSYSAKVQDVVAPHRLAPSSSGRFILLAPLPVEVDWAGKVFRLHMEQEPVSKELRLFAKDVEQERRGLYSAYLLASAGKERDLSRRIFIDGITCESRPGYGMFSQLEKEGLAKAL